MNYKEEFKKDCPENIFVPVVLPAVERIIAIGDIHGDLKLAHESFKLAKLIDDNLNWIAQPRNTIVVQVGDQIDSCRPISDVYDCHNIKMENDKAEDVEIMEFFNMMDKKARVYGGAVYSLLGNHELMNVDGMFEYASYDNYYNFKYKTNNNDYNGPIGRKQAFSPGGPLANMMACSRTSVIIIGSNMFVHAGIIPSLLEELIHVHNNNIDKLEYLNYIIRKWLLGKISSNHVNKMMFIDNMKLSPFWTRTYGMISENANMDDCNTVVAEILKIFKIKHIIVGHTPQLFTNNNGINGICNINGHNSLFRIDGGFSRAFKIFGNQNMTQVLEILNDKTFNILSSSSMYHAGGYKRMRNIKSKKSMINYISLNNRLKYQRTILY